MTVVVGACDFDVAVIATDTRLSREGATGREVVRDDETKLRYSGKGWYAGAGYAQAIDVCLEVLRAAPISDTEDVRKVLVLGRKQILEPLKREHPEHAASIDGTSTMLTVRIPEGPAALVFSPPLFGNELRALLPGTTWIIPPLDLPPAIAQEIAATAGSYVVGTPTQQERVAAVASAVARSAAAVVAKSGDVSDRLDIGVHRVSEEPGRAALLRFHGPSTELAECRTLDDFMKFYVSPSQVR